MIIQELFESPQQCPECGGPSFSDLILAEKKDACYHKVKATAKVWPSAYASGRLVQCRKKGAANWGNKSKNESVAEGSLEEYGDTAKGQKMLTRVQKRAVDRVIRADDKNRLEPDYTKRDIKTVRKNQDTADRAWDRMTDLDEQSVAEDQVNAF